MTEHLLQGSPSAVVVIHRNDIAGRVEKRMAQESETSNVHHVDAALVLL